MLNALQKQIIDNCYNQLRITSRRDAAILGYCVKLAYGATRNKDGSISYCGFFEHRNDEQWEAERTMDQAIKEIGQNV